MDTNVNPDGTLITDVDGDPCSQYAHMPGFCGRYDTADFRSVNMCCACGGGTERIESPIEVEESGDEADNENADDGGEDNDDTISINCQC